MERKYFILKYGIGEHGNRVKRWTLRWRSMASESHEKEIVRAKILEGVRVLLLKRKADVPKISIV